MFYCCMLETEVALASVDPGNSMMCLITPTTMKRGVDNFSKAKLPLHRKWWENDWKVRANVLSFESWSRRRSERRPCESLTGSVRCSAAWPSSNHENHFSSVKVKVASIYTWFMNQSVDEPRSCWLYSCLAFHAKTQPPVYLVLINLFCFGHCVKWKKKSRLVSVQDVRAGSLYYKQTSSLGFLSALPCQAAP